MLHWSYLQGRTPTAHFLLCWLIIRDHIVIENIFKNAEVRDDIKDRTVSLGQTSFSFHWGNIWQENKIGAPGFLAFYFEICKTKQQRYVLISSVHGICWIGKFFICNYNMLTNHLPACTLERLKPFNVSASKILELTLPRFFYFLTRTR